MDKINGGSRLGSSCSLQNSSSVICVKSFISLCNRLKGSSQTDKMHVRSLEYIWPVGGANERLPNESNTDELVQGRHRAA